ncbi:MAG: hypothetical protein LBE55_05570 [Clostridiales bacterium]|nr:hypothetical protein [Clostridiales bacterium]
MKTRLFTVVAAFMVLVLGMFVTNENVYANTDAEIEIPSAAEIQQLLTDMLPDFIETYGYDLLADLNRAGLSLGEFAGHLHNYLAFLYEADILDQQEFSVYGENWLFYFVDGIVRMMSESDASVWGNVSLKGLVLNNIYVEALPPALLVGFFTHNGIAYLAENLEIAAYFDFLMRESTLDVVLPFGAAARALFEYSEVEEIIGLIGLENLAAMGQMEAAVRINFLAGLLLDRIAPNLDYVIYYYQDFIIIPSPDLVVPVNISRDASQQAHELRFFADTAFVVNTDIGDANLDIFIYNSGAYDFFMTMQTYNADGAWHIFLIDFVPAGERHMHLLPHHADLGAFFRVTVYGVDGGIISGAFGIEVQ